MRHIYQLVLLNFRNVLKKKTLYIYLGFMSLLILRFIAWGDDFSEKSRLSDYLSWAHLFGTWFLLFLNVSIFEEIISPRSADGLLALGVKRKDLYGAAIVTVVVVLLLWNASVLAISLVMVRPGVEMLLRLVTSYFFLTVQLISVQNLIMLFLMYMPINSAVIVGITMYILGGSILVFVPPLQSLPPWILPLGSTMFHEINTYMFGLALSPKLIQSLLGTVLWFVVLSIVSISRFEDKDLVA